MRQGLNSLSHANPGKFSTTMVAAATSILNKYRINTRSLSLARQQHRVRGCCHDGVMLLNSIFLTNTQHFIHKELLIEAHMHGNISDIYSTIIHAPIHTGRALAYLSGSFM